MYIRRLLYDTKIKTKVLCLTVVGIFTFVTFTAGAFILGKDQIKSLEELYVKNIVPLDKLRHIQIIFREIEFSIGGVIAGIIKPEDAVTHLETSIKGIDEIWRDISILLINSDYIEEKQNFARGYEGFREKSRTFQDTYTRMINGDERAAVKKIYNEWLVYKPQLLDSLDNLAEIQESLVKEYYEKRRNFIHNVIIVILAGALCMTIISILVAVVIIRAINRPVQKVMEAANHVAIGDLTYEITLGKNDELGIMAKELNRMLKKLNQIFATITGETERLFEHAEGLAGVSDLLVSGSQEQKSQVDQVLVSTSQMTDSITEVGKNASSASEITKVSFNSAESGNGVVEQTKESIEKLARNVSGASVAIGDLGNSSKRIGEIVSVIQDIADQTNLLALNAAIESARAGEQGRGFAVVADEVRKLAERTTQATEEVTDIIRTIQRETADVISRLQEGKKLTDAAMAKAEEAGESHKAIVNNSGHVMSMVQNIATATEEQSAVSIQVNQSMQSIAGVINQTFILSENIGSVSSELVSIASQLKGQVKNFTTQSQEACVDRPETPEITDVNATLI